MVAQYQRISTSVKVAIVTAISTITVAFIGAWQVAASTASSNNGLTRSEVRQLIQQEAPVNARGAQQLFETLNRIDDNVARLQVDEGIDHALIEQLVKGRQK